MSEAASTSGFEQALRVERARLMRRRLMWFAGFWLVVLLMVTVHYWPKAGAMPSREEANNLLTLLPDLAMNGAVFWIAMRYRPGLGTLRWMAAALVIGTGVTDITGMVRAEELRQGTVIMSGRFLFTCFFIPWTVREALVPMAGLAAMGLVTAGLNVVFGRGDGWSLAFLPLGLLPGLAQIAMRQRVFMRQFRLGYESRKYREVQEDLAGARRIHETCLAKPVQTGPVRFVYEYEPMREIGGDFLFAHRPAGSNGVLTLVLIDVMGHGIGSALTVNRLSGELERIFGETEDLSPAGAMRALNRYVYLTLSRHGIYATALCVRVDAEAGRVTWVGAGHPAGMLRRKGGEVELLESKAMMLGVESHEDFGGEESGCSIGPGDVVVVYTDGAEEARNEKGELFGSERLEGLLRKVAKGEMDRWPAMMLKEVVGHRDGPPQDDTLVVVAYLGEGAEGEESAVKAGRAGGAAV